MVFSGSGRRGTISGRAESTEVVCRDLPSQGGGDRIAAPAIPVPATDFTVAAWFNWTTNPSPYYSGIQGGGCCSWELRVTANGRFAVVFYQAIHPDIYTYAETSLIYNDDVWHHAAGVLRAHLCALYTIGVRMAPSTTNTI